MDKRAAFCGAVKQYRAGDWRPAEPDKPRLNIDGRSYTIVEICEMTAGINDQLPDDTVGHLRFGLRAHSDLLENLDKTPSYGTGATCLLALMSRRKTDYQEREALRRRSAAE
jgi:hypothetical protein